MSVLKDFQQAVLIQRVAYRFAKEFSTEKALHKYLQDHPDADKSKHSVGRGGPKKVQKEDSDGGGTKSTKSEPGSSSAPSTHIPTDVMNSLSDALDSASFDSDTVPHIKDLKKNTKNNSGHSSVPTDTLKKVLKGLRSERSRSETPDSDKKKLNKAIKSLNRIMTPSHQREYNG